MSIPDIRADAAELAPGLVRLRRELHAEPECGLELPRTQRRVLAALDGLPLEITLGKQLSSVVAILRGGAPGPAVLLRADMDALPVQEATGLPYSSTVPGIMHACGHDLHTAMLVGAARLLSVRRDQIAGSVIFMFQPGEERDAGARLMIEEGVLEAAGDRPVAAYALHVASAFLPPGQFGTRPGALTASADELHVTITGVGGHGATPALAKDPIAAACATITTLQARIARDFGWADPAVVSIGTIHAGCAANVIPAEVRFTGTIRSFSASARERVITTIREVADAVAAAYGVRADATIRQGYPAVINDPAETRMAAEAARDTCGPDRVTHFAAPVPAAEDFAFILSEVPGAYLFLGASSADANPLTVPFNHAPEVIFDDAVLTDGAALLAAVTLRRLA